MNPEPTSRADEAPASSPPVASDASRRAVVLDILLGTFDLYVRSVAEIAAETGLSGELTVETLMAYAVALPEADELIHGFIRGDQTLFPPAEQNRELVDRDTRRLELEAPVPEWRPATRLGRKLEPRPSSSDARPHPERTSELDRFIKENPEIFRQVCTSSHPFLVRWVMLHLLEAAQARERVHRIAHEFWKQFPDVRQRVSNRAPRQSPLSSQKSQPQPLTQRMPVKSSGMGLR